MQAHSLVPSLSLDDLFEFIREGGYDEEDKTKIKFFSKIFSIGVLIKIGAAPFHQWVSDNYVGVSIYTNMIFATLTKAIFFFSLFEAFLNFSAGEIIKISMIFSLIVGCYFSLRQN